MSGPRASAAESCEVQHVNRRNRRYDAVVVGAGPNGLAAAITLARAGRSVLLREAKEEIGGGLRSAELLLPGVVHDVCAAVFPLSVSSPFFASTPLGDFGLEWVHPPAPLAYPFPDGRVAMLERSLDETARGLGRDGRAWRALLSPFVDRWSELASDVLAPLRIPRHPFLMGRFGLSAIRSAYGLSRGKFKDDAARLLIDTNAAHSMVPLDQSPTASFGLVLVIAAHAAGWPIARGGSSNIARAMGAYFRSLGGEIETSAPVTSLDEVTALGNDVFFDVTPRQFLRIAGDALTGRYRRALERFRYGGGVFKVDWALSGPIPWSSSECTRAGTVHVCGTLAEFEMAESAALRGEVAERPFLLVGQPTLIDSSRAPAGTHVAWAYTHVPHGCDVDMTARMEAQMERFAPGFRDLVLARKSWSPAGLEEHDANLVGGDISAGMMDLRQLFFRPAIKLNPYKTSIDGVYLCSASTPPGGAVHGMCGYYAARAALGRGVAPAVASVKDAKRPGRAPQVPAGR